MCAIRNILPLNSLCPPAILTPYSSRILFISDIPSIPSGTFTDVTTSQGTSAKSSKPKEVTPARAARANRECLVKTFFIPSSKIFPKASWRENNKFTAGV